MTTSANAIQGIAIKIIPNAADYPVGKRADAELHFVSGPLTNLKLVGFAVWSTNKTESGLNVTFPARSYTQNGQKKNYSLLRSTTETFEGNDKLRDLIIKAYQSTMTQLAAAVASQPGLPNTINMAMKHSTPQTVAESTDAGMIHALAELL